MSRFFLFIAVKVTVLLMLMNGTQAQSLSGKTIVFYERSHGIQVEYFNPSGKAHLWYPGNRVVVNGKWKIDGKNNVCFQYGPNTYNPVTRRRGGSWICRSYTSFSRSMKYQCRGDVFGLSKNRIPYVLMKFKLGLGRIKAKCGSPV